mgnify:CR=1 FL=1
MNFKNNIMIKFSKKSIALKLNGLVYKGYTLGNLPDKFAFIYDEDKDQQGIKEWFNYKGFTWVCEY